MSEEMDLNVNNLSAAGEAFEVSQSNSSYLENEGISSPGRECSQPAAVDAAELSDMSIENDLVSSTNNEDQSQLTYCNLDVGSEVNINEDEPDETNTAFDLGNEANSEPHNLHETDYVQEQSNAVSNDVDNEVDMELDETVETEAVSSSEVCQPTSLSSSKQGRGRGRGRGRARGRGRGRGKGRGRKTITNNDSTSINFGTDISSDISANISSEPFPENTLQSANNNMDSIQTETNGFLVSPSQSTETPTEQVPVTRKRGRKKKEPPVLSDTGSLESPEVVSPKVRCRRAPPIVKDTGSSQSPVVESPRVSRRRGRPRKNSSLNDITENQTTVNGDSLPVNASSTEMKDLNKMVKNLSQLEDKLRKLQDNLSNIENLEEDEDDDEEDMCLSQLKTSIDCEKASEAKDPILQGLQEMPSSPLAEPETDMIEESASAPSAPITQAEVIKDNDATTTESNTPLTENVTEDNDTSEKVTTENITTENVTTENVTTENVTTECATTENATTENAIAEKIIGKEVENKSMDNNESLLVEGTSKRPKRRNARKTFKYRNDDDSDEDPFANVELSDDDEPRRKKKSGRYNSDDEYIPGRKGRESSIDSSDSAVGDALDELEELKMTTKKRGRMKKEIQLEEEKMPLISDIVSQSPLKASSLNQVEDKKEPWRFSPNAVQDLCDDTEVQPSVNNEIKPTPPPQSSNTWGSSKEFENFLAKKIHGTNLKIKKVSKKSNLSPSVVAPIEIPVLEANEVKKKVEVSSQTNKVTTETTSTQTSGPCTLSMKTNVPLNSEQSENACKFLTSIVKTTSELGTLMTQKSDDFIQKKINTTNVVDTFKIDYCVKKSFLLLKLAKHNIMQMEEDLTNQYEKFLQENDLSSYREQEKKLEPTPKKEKEDSDSDCEIVGETPPQKVEVKKESKPKFNPKTVFLNKELSIKIAKKPSEEVKSNKNINIKGRHTVWISDSVMVKKVKGPQSFLAQDSRNKKPPDNKITEKMVSDFFEDYYRQKALFTCAPFVSTEWSTWQHNRYICQYFTVEPDNLTNGNISRTEENFTDNESNPSVSESGNELSEKIKCEVSKLSNPTTLLSICLKNLHEHFYLTEPSDVNNTFPIPECTNDTSAALFYQPKTLFSSCCEHLKKNEQNSRAENKLLVNASVIVPQNLPSQKGNHFRIENADDDDDNQEEDIKLLNASEILSHPIPSLKALCYLKITCCVHLNNEQNLRAQNKLVNDSEIVPQNLPSLKGNYFIVENSDEDSDNQEEDAKLLNASEILSRPIPSLKALCYLKITKLDFTNCIKSDNKTVMSNSEIDETEYYESDFSCDDSSQEVKSLSTLCVQIIQRSQKVLQPNKSSDFCIRDSFSFRSPNSLMHIAFKCITSLLKECHISDPNKSQIDIVCHVTPRNVKKLADICFDIVSKLYEADNSQVTVSAETPPIALTINAVNTLSEEAFLNIEENTNDQDNSDYYEDDAGTLYEDESMEPNYNEDEDANHRENESWISKVQLKELMSCAVSDKQKNGSKSIPENENVPVATENYPLIANVKTELGLEEKPAIAENFVPFIKTEPDHYVDQMTIIPESVVTKTESFDNVDPLPVGREPIQRQNSTSFDEENFENFVRCNKMIHAISTYENENEETFSQSALRVRRQHEPDSDNENDTSMSLLVPHTFEALTVESAKGSLLENSESDSENVGKKNNKRKPGRPKTKKPQPPKQTKEVPAKENKEVPSKENKEVQSKEHKEVQSKDKPVPVNELAILTRRMRERIRQEEKKGESSDSDSENVAQTSKQEKETKKETRRSRLAAKNNKNVDDEIQCNNVDSTEQITDTTANKSKDETGTNPKEDNKFTGFSAVDQNEISTYHKYVKYVYDQILPKVNEETELKTTEENSNKDEKTKDNKKESDEIINSQEPIELLECTPTMPIFEEEEAKPNRKSITKSPGKKKEAKHAKEELVSKDKGDAKHDNDAKKELFGKVTEKSELFTERNGWKCYPILSSDTKLYEQIPIIALEKLPESFVQTYFEYQDIAVKSKDDEEIDRLTNLQSLNRVSSVKKPRARREKVPGEEQDKSFQDGNDRPESPADAGHYNELLPSEDEGDNYEDDFTTPGPDATENNMAKNLLMNDDDDEDDTPLSHRKIKNEVDGDATFKKKRPGPKSKTVDIKQEHPDSLMLTADKMMNKELTLLHAPVVLDNENAKTPVKGPLTRNKPRSGTKSGGKGERRKSDDSSSEEEKQWVNTKEKLLKRMGKKQETAMEDDAKRAKLVSEFIERRNTSDKPLILNHKTRGRSRRSRKKMLERQKQMRVLSYELLGEAGPHGPKGNSAAYFKGRRNIRKVIDKKSLARSTVIANMEEFERKRRLSMKQKQLEEILGCEEGVNVIVTNDEVCLEYDFNVGQPAVTVHPFFTKVMKAHQYEGVKFMWDACFESLERVQSGHPGGGCILAHCMGLGKTLQVLALLHTVLTHPGVGMRRVLVCCPLSTVLNWVDEIHKWIGPVTDEIKPNKMRRKLQVFELSKLRKTYERAYQLEDWYNGGGIFIIGYELFRSLTTLDAELDDVRQTIIDKIRTALLDPGPDIIVCDEGHLLKNDCSVLAVAMSRVATRRRIVLTGTPMQNNLREYYCMVNFVKPNLLGTYSEYSNRFENPIMNGQHRDSVVEDIKLMKARTHILHKVLEGCLQRQEASVLYPYLPKKHEYTVFISLTKCQCDLYKHYLNVYANKNKQSILKDFHTLQKIWSHPQVLHNFNMKARDEKIKVKAEKLEDDLAREDLTASEDIKPSSTDVWWLQYLDGGDMLERLESSNKFITVFRILEEAVALDDKVLIFSTSLITMDSLEYFLKKINNWSLGQEYYRLDGSVPPEVRQKWCREFNAEHNYKTKLFLISTRAGSLGLNMTAANRVIILDTSWNPAHDIQSIFRVYRFGQKKDCFIYRLVALGTMEQKIYERAVTKQAVSCRVVDEQQIDRHYNMAELTELYRFDETGTSVAGGVAVGVQDVVLLRVARDAALHAVHEHDSLLRGSEAALSEHERAAAWQQFQQETQHNQMPQGKVPKKEKKAAKRSLPLVPVPNVKSTLPEVKPEPHNDAEYTPTEPKPKRGRKKIINCRIPIQTTPQPSTSSQPDYFVDRGQETDIVAQISQILVSHDFNNRRTSRDLSKLISTVQQVVASGDLSSLPPGDEAATAIAQILLRKHSPVAAPPMPALTDIRTPPALVDIRTPPALVDIRTTPALTDIRTAPALTNIQTPPALTDVQHTIPSNQPLEQEDAETITGDLTSKPDANVKRKRRAAVSAQKKFDTIADDVVIDLNDDDWRNDDDFIVAPTRNPEPEKVERKEKKYKPGPKSKKKPTEIPPVETPQQLAQTIQQSINVEESILLSDDDIVPESRPPPVTVKQEPSTKKGDEEKYPLHPSLLTNENFIKIVAHTYLAGNPMLDEDAATLAARYSTSKALRETEATGKPIESGPIYDIAVQVLGIDILKKLHTSGPTADAKTNKQNQKALSDTEKKLSVATATPEPKQGLLKPKVTSDLMPKERKPMIANLGRVKLTPVTPVIAAPVVVPVGLIKNTSNSGAVAEECILPDDDDVHVVAEPAPPRRAPLPLHSAGAGAGRLLQDERLLTNIKVPIAPAPQAPPAPGAAKIKVAGSRPAPGPPAGTICLDSDDEDAAPPVPVTLTAATGARLELQMPHETPLRPARVEPVLDVDYYIGDGNPHAPPPAPGPSRRLARLAPKHAPATVCKPGDIIRIGKTGMVEVLSKVDSVPVSIGRGARPAPGKPAGERVSPAAGPKSAQSKIAINSASHAAAPKLTEPKTAPKPMEPKTAPKPTEPKTAPKPTERVTPKPAAKPAPKPAEKVAPKPALEPTEKPVRVDSGSSSSSRSASPVDADPLSILKDVVQIPADRYQSILSGQTTAEPYQSTPKSSSSKPTPQATPSKVNTTKKPPEKQPSILQKLNALKDIKAKEILKKTAEKPKKTITITKSSSAVFDSVDLTDVVAAPAPESKPDKVASKSSVTTKPSKKIETVVGTSKNIILTTKNKIAVGPAPPSSKSSVRVTNMETLAPATVKGRVDKKRPAIKQEPEAPKRKKTEPMTLKDFDIDDIDDIIELE
ncbi:uncharacterized protein LOC133527946 isoform X2 [Cydia pomonella]|uniref:uncharacterized protein LOC133527946 isoform X2 n=1 Tax=Cydia pomonella TaxID=82600 RepID=UPI002ADE31A6|nr:uncharacterized protein LOC133527946 isoform X2 [Cydia pomonella]